VQHLTRISLVRHGDVHNPGQIIYGRLPRFSLSSRGTEDARKAAFYLKDVSLAAIYCSPLLRTRQTAAEIQRYHPGLSIQQSSMLLEVKTSFEGKPETQLDSVLHNVYHSSEQQGYEQPVDVLNRSLRFLTMVRRRHAERHVAAATHGDVILFLTMWAKEIGITAENKLNLYNFNAIPEYPATGSITTLAFLSDDSTELPNVHYINTRKFS